MKVYNLVTVVKMSDKVLRGVKLWIHFGVFPLRVFQAVMSKCNTVKRSHNHRKHKAFMAAAT